MGSSPDATVFFGVDFGYDDEDNKPWEDDFEDWLVEQSGGTTETSDEIFADYPQFGWKDGFEKRKAWEADHPEWVERYARYRAEIKAAVDACPVEEVRYGYMESGCAGSGLALKGETVRIYDTAAEFKFPGGPSLAASIRAGDWCKEHGIDWFPKWLAVASYG